MINAVIFDLDGTLINSERLKAECYHRAMQQLGRNDVNLDEVVEMYKEVVGKTRHEISRGVMEAFDLEPFLRPLVEKYRVNEPAHVLTAMRVKLYEELTADDEVLRANQWPYTVDLVRAVHSNGCRLALATSSLTSEALRAVAALGLQDAFEAVIGLDQVTKGKPDPEIYLKAASMLGVEPEHCMVIEDSPPGVTAGLAAGMNVIGVANPMTLLSLHNTALGHDWIVHEPDALAATVDRRIWEHNNPGVHRD